MISAEQIAEGLGARRYGNSWRCPCPVCGENNQSKFKISEGNKGPLVYCFAGCDFRTVVAELEERGLWEKTEKPAGPPKKKVEWARWLVPIYEAAKRNGERLSAQDHADYRKAKAVLNEAREVGNAA